MQLVFVEPLNTECFAPIALARPVFDLLCGSRSTRQRILDELQPKSWGVILRSWLQPLFAQEYPQATVNDLRLLEQPGTILIHAQWVGDPATMLAGLLKQGEFRVQGQLVACRWDESRPRFSTAVELQQWWDQQHDMSENSAENAGHWLAAPWDVVNANSAAIELDYQLLQAAHPQSWQDKIPASSLCGTASNPSVWIDPTAIIEPFVSINAEAGPVIIDAGAVVQSFTRLEGPCYVGQETQLFRANIRAGTSLGPVCRIGGEVEASIVHGYANKYHEGFLGHSYVCPWVNMGALTTNSDLKNDYSPVTVIVNGQPVRSGEKKVGLFIGDHAKTAIGTLFNTGSTIGVMSMILPAGRLCPKHIPSFGRYWQGKIDDQVDLETAFETARIAMKRRGHEFSSLQETLYQELHVRTAEERRLAIERAISRGDL